MEKINDLLKLNNIIERSGDIKVFPLATNIKRANYSKGSWREVTIAIDNESVRRLWNNDVVGILYIVGRNEWTTENK